MSLYKSSFVDQGMDVLRSITVRDPDKARTPGDVIRAIEIMEA